MTLRTLRADWHGGWKLVWKRDDPWHPNGRVWFDRNGGRLIWEDPDPGGRLSHSEIDPPAEVLNDPGSYEEVPVLSHGEHHEIFAEYVATLPDEVRLICNTASIGGFRETLYSHFPEVSDEHWEGWLEFHDAALRTLAEEWLKEQGWAPGWV